MRKALLVMLAMMTIGLSSGCADIRAMTIDVKKETTETAQSIVAALDARDAEALRSLMSQKTIREATDLDEGIAYTMELYQGTSIRFEEHGNAYCDHYGTPGRTKSTDACYEIWTEYEHYTLYFELWHFNEADPTKEGVYRIVLKTYADNVAWAESMIEERAATGKVYKWHEWLYGGTYERPGIFHPGWME